VNSTTKTAQVRLARSSPAYCRVTFDNPPLNLMGPEFVLQFKEIMTELETDEQVKVVVFESAVEGFFLNHSEFPRKTRGTDQHTSRPHRPGGVAGHPGAADSRGLCIDCFDPRAGDRKRE
jgi:hypothetical protein